MNTNTILPYIHALRPILYFQCKDFRTVDDTLREVIGNAPIREFWEGLGAVDFGNNKNLVAKCSLCEFLNHNKDNGYGKEVFLVLKDVHGRLHDPDVTALLKYISERTLYIHDYQQTAIIVSCECVIPKELEQFITIIPQELPDQKAIEGIIRSYAADLGFDIKEEDVGELALELKGFSLFQIKQILDLAYADGGMVSAVDKEFILSEKKQIIHKSGLLEYIDSDPHATPIGGLHGLTEWLDRKAKIFRNLNAALKNGVDMPKGVLIMGFPGCGKSLTAKTTASRFGVPLLRLDVGRVLGKYVGESEKNMRDALAQAEAISPCVLWVDEIEKAFAGSAGDNAHEVTTRLIGHFLTWMQEKTSTVFVVATANDLDRLPTEFLRKGRFDEIFSVDLPTSQERLEILKIHLKKRKLYDAALDLSSTVKNTEGFSGADLEAVVASAVEDFFLKRLEADGDKPKSDALSTEDLERAREEITPLSKALKSKYEKMEKKLQEYSVRKAYSDRETGSSAPRKRSNMEFV